jgi:hypothetical protein
MKLFFLFRRKANACATPRWQSLFARLFICQLACLPCGLFAQVDPCSLAWHRILPANSPNSPGLLINQAVAYDSRRHVAVLFGGENPYTEVFSTSDTWEWDGNAWIKRSSGQPSTRTLSAMAYDSDRGVCVLFGGGTNIFDYETPFNDTWEWDGSTWSLRSGNDPAATDRPPPLDYPVLVYDSARKRTVLSGDVVHIGFSTSPLTQTWEWDGTHWSAHATAPPPRAYGAMAYDPVRGVTVLFGGLGDYSSLNDTWTWDGTTWREITTGGVPPRNQAAMAFDDRRGVMVMFGGMGDDVTSEYNDTWQWMGGFWALDPYADRFGLIPRRLAKMWYDTGDQKLVVFGGTYGVRNADGSYSYTILDDMWEARPPGYWVDFNYAGQPSLPETGDFYTPYNTLVEAVNAAPDGCTLNLKTGSHAETLTISKPLQLQAYNGLVTIGR